MPRTTVPAVLAIQEVEQPALLFRVVKSDDPDSDLFDEAFRSSYELGRPPRKVETRLAVIHMSLSMNDDGEKAAAVARKWRALGEWIAELELQPGRGTCYAKTGQPGHWSVWGDPHVLKAAVRGIVYIGDA